MQDQHKKQQGLSMVLLLLTISLASFSSWALYHWQILVIRQDRDLVFKRLASALRYAQTLAIAENHFFSVCGNTTTSTSPAKASWQTGFQVIKGKQQANFTASKPSPVQSFAGPQSGRLVFLSSTHKLSSCLQFQAGNGESHPNGRFLYCPPFYAKAEADFFMVNLKGSRLQKAQLPAEAWQACLLLP